MNNKKKIIAICVCVALLAGTILSGTIAYFTDNEAIKNTFTSGNVMIDLTENAEQQDGTIVKIENQDENTTFADYKLFPGDEITKQPIITVEEGSEKAYVAAKIAIKAGDLTEVFDPEIVTDGKLEIGAFIQGGIFDPINATIEVVADADKAEEVLVGKTATADYVMYQDFTADAETVNVDNDGTYTFYIYKVAYVDAMEAEKTITLFDELVVDADWDNAQMDELKKLSIDVQAYAVQEEHIADCYTAMTSAFEKAFPATVNA